MRRNALRLLRPTWADSLLIGQETLDAPTHSLAAQAIALRYPDISELMALVGWVEPKAIPIAPSLRGQATRLATRAMT
jgi:hypothetical protein